MKQKILKLPYTFDDLNNYTPVEPSDSAFLSGDFVSSSAMLEDTSNFYILIALLPSDDLIPMIFVMDKKGNKLDSLLLTDGCPSYAPCTSHCSWNATINKDLSILLTDSMISFNCDSLDNKISGTDSLFWSTLSGKITKAGSIGLGVKKTQSKKYSEKKDSTAVEENHE